MALSFAQELWERDVDEGREDHEPKVTTCGVYTHNKLPIPLQVRPTRQTATSAVTTAGFPTRSRPNAASPVLPRRTLPQYQRMAGVLSPSDNSTFSSDGALCLGDCTSETNNHRFPRFSRHEEKVADQGGKQKEAAAERLWHQQQRHWWHWYGRREPLR